MMPETEVHMCWIVWWSKDSVEVAGTGHFMDAQTPNSAIQFSFIFSMMNLSGVSEVLWPLILTEKLCIMEQEEFLERF